MCVKQSRRGDRPSPNHFSLYGLTIRLIGATGTFPALPASAPAEVAIDVRGLPSWLESAPRTEWFCSPVSTVDAKPGLIVSQVANEPYLYFEFGFDIRFSIRQDGSYAWGTWDRQHFEFSYVLPVILGPVMGAILRLRAVTTLHASVVGHLGAAMVLVGSGGVGKSTTAGAFARLGFAILSDDLAPIRVLNDSFSVSPGYPRVCLWPRSVEILFGSANALPSITAGWEKQYLDLNSPGFQFCSRPLPIGAIYWLSGRVDAEDAPSISSVSTQEALITLLANTYRSDLPDRNLAAVDLRLFARLLSRVPVRQVTAHSSPARLEELCQLIAKDFEDVHY